MESTRTSPSGSHGSHHGSNMSSHHGSSERSAALQAAAAVAAAVTGFGSGNLPVGMGLSSLVPVGLMSHLQHHEQQQQQQLHQQQHQNASNSNNNSNNSQRKQREFIPDNKKDDSYWDRRRRNNEAAKRSREKRRLNDMVLESRVLELTKENHILRAQLNAVRDKYGINPDGLVSIDQVLATLPSPDQVLSLPRPRSRLLSGLSPSMGGGCGGSSGGGSVSPAPSNRSLSPPLVHVPQQHSHQQPPQQQRQSVLMSMNRSQRSPSPISGPSGKVAAHRQHTYTNGHGHHGHQQQSYRFQGSDAIVVDHSFQEQSDSSANHQPHHHQIHHHHQSHHHVNHQQHHLHHSQGSKNQQRLDRSLPPLPALTPPDVIHHLNVTDRSASGGVPSATSGYFDLCSSSNSNSSSSSHPGSSSGDDGSHSPIDPAVAAGRVLPLKLRHKTHLGDRDVAAATASAAAALLTLNDIKHEPESIDDSPSVADSTVDNGAVLEMNNNVGEADQQLAPDRHHHQQQQPIQHLQYQLSGRRSTESSDDRDSGISSGGDWPLPQTRNSSSRYSGNNNNNGPHNNHLYQQLQPASKRMRMSPQSPSTSHHHHYNQVQQQQAGRKVAVRIANGALRVSNHQENGDEEADSASANALHERAVNGGNESSDENDELRSHIARLASELESLKTLMLGAGGASSAGGSSMRGNKPNATNNLRLHH
uniref:EOG090X08JU n=1 Tax=Scapholeberis mucronata TaxID=202097 RepID=A0A4Y7NKJ6_9CRUS|nr:EOG090X08JU [Scapholeberis mucronata]SVE93702.1 EOG090X08JU [Scapholeberis mucronata]